MGTVSFASPTQQAKLDEIRALLKSGPASGEQVADLLGVVYDSALPYLNHLRGLGQAQRPEPGRLWMAGPSAAWLAALERDPPKVVRVDAAAAGRQHVRRDPLVAALFGPAKTRPPSES